MTTYVAAATRSWLWNTTGTNANFQTFCTRFKAMLDGSGLMQTSDTGQLDPATITFPTTNNTAPAYLIYRFADAQQGTDPIFLKFFLGRGANSAWTYVAVQIGQGSNGSGTLTGMTSGSINIGNNYVTVGIDPMTTDYAIHRDGFFGCLQGAVPDAYNYPPRHWFMIERTRDPSTGNFDGVGVFAHFTNGGDPQIESAVYYLNWTSGNPASGGGAGGSGSLDFCLAVGAAATDSNGSYIAWPHFYYNEGVVRQGWAAWTTSAASLPTGANTFDASPYGVSRRWLAIGDQNGRCVRGLGVNSANWGMVMLWET